jgi:N-carbamoylputrescine amidase
MRIALVQQHAIHDRKDNLERGLGALDTAAAGGADLVCYAELAFEPFYPQRPAEDDPKSLAQEVPGPVTEAFSKRAADLGVVVVLNLYERDGQHCFDSSPVIDADGSLLGRARMVHITDYPCFHEQGYYAPATTATTPST